MKRFVRSFLLVVLLAFACGPLIVLWRAPDPVYVIQEWLGGRRYHQYDDLIREVAQKHQVAPELVKAVVWRESGFVPQKLGKHGELGLMQILPSTAGDWARAAKRESFNPDELLDPRTNLEAGTWYLKQALVHWSDRDDPVPFALAEYNAGRVRAHRWNEETRMGANATADDFFAAISFPRTRDYVDSITERYRYYQARGRL